jgi:hypothetical protein
MATSDKTGKPDATTDVETVETMSLEAIQAELREPATASAVAQGEEHRARRQALWARLDVLTRSGAGGPAHRGGAQAS